MDEWMNESKLFEIFHSRDNLSWLSEDDYLDLKRPSKARFFPGLNTTPLLKWPNFPTFASFNQNLDFNDPF